MRSSADQQCVDQLRLLVDAVGDYAIFLLDREGRVATWNTGAARLKGYTAEEIIGEHFSRFYTEPDRARDHPAEELEIAAREGSYHEEGWRVRKDGTLFCADVTITALRDEQGELLGYGKVTRDLTERRAAEQQPEQFRLLVASVRDYAIFVLDPAGHILSWNEGARRIKGYEEAEVIGRHFSLFYTAEDKAREHPAHELEIATREGSYEEEGWRVRRDGTRFWANVVITALRDDEGTLVGFAKVTRDLTERRRSEEALRETNADLERFAAAVAHDLTEPLHTIVGLAELTSRRYADALDEQGREYLAFVSDGARRMRRLLDGLLAYSRASQRDLRVRSVDVAAALGSVLEGLRARIAESAARIEFEAAALPRVMADPELLEIVLQNLVANGLKFSEGVPRVTISARAEDGLWRIEVADAGIGIDTRDQDTIFGLFNRLHTQERYEGAGLGLTMCSRIVERHGGTMGVESVPGKGSRFWFTLPAAP